MITKVTGNDLNEISKLHLKHFKQIGESKDSIRNYYESELWEFYVAKEKNKVVGYIVFHLFNNFCHLNWFGVKSGHEDVAIELFKFLEKISKKNKKKYVQLVSRNRYRKAISFYLKNDFDIYGTYVGQDSDIMIQLRKKLKY